MEHHDSHHMQQLLQYISHNRANGVSDAHIRHALLETGWPPHLVDRGMHGDRHMPTSSIPPAPQPVHHQSQHPAHVQAQQKYKVFKAFGEAWDSVRANLLAFVLSLLIAVGAMLVSLLPLALIVMALAQGLASDDASVVVAVLSLIGIFAVVWAWYVLVASFMFSVIAIAVNDGANRHHSRVGSVLSRATGVFGRVAAANVWSGLVALGPPLIALILLLIGVAASGDSLRGSYGSAAFVGVLTLIGTVASVVWIMLCAVRFALAPFIAAFEPHVAPRRALARSRELLRGGGIWFIWKLILIALAIQLILGVVTGTPLSELDRNQHPAVTIIQLIMAVISVTVLLMLYRNRYARHHR